MDPSDAADAISEVGEDEEAAAKGKSGDEKFRARAALTIAIMAMLLAITSLGGGNVAEDIMDNNIQASNRWAFYQAKNDRQTANKIAADELEVQIQLNGASITPEMRTLLEKRVQQYKETAARYDDEPSKEEPDNPLKGDGKKQLAAQAKYFEEQRNLAMKQDTNFDFAEALFQIAIVLASVAILSYSRMILKLSIVVGVVSTILMLNGYFLFFALPF
jgi:shikimate kinase